MLNIKPKRRQLPNSTNRDLFTTYDAGLAAALVCLGYKLQSINWPRHSDSGTFSFSPNTDELRRSADLYDRGELNINAHKFAITYQKLRYDVGLK